MLIVFSTDLGFLMTDVVGLRSFTPQSLPLERSSRAVVFLLLKLSYANLAPSACALESTQFSGLLFDILCCRPQKMRQTVDLAGVIAKLTGWSE
jgi:hypothetical protein